MLNENSEPNIKNNKSFQETLTGQILLPTVVGIFLFFIEYKTGWFNSSPDSTKIETRLHFLIFLNGFTATAFILSIKKSLHIFSKPQQYFREDFSLSIIKTIIWLFVLLLLASVYQLMPWHILYIICQNLSNIKTSIPRANWAEYALVIAVIYIIYSRSEQCHKQWKGSKSTEQHHQEQYGYYTNLIMEGLQELWKRKTLRRNPILEQHKELEINQPLLQLELTIDSKAWKDEARKLLQLSSSSYAFDTQSDWHDKRKCWVGRNIDTGKLVFLYPIQSNLTQAEIQDIYSYIDQISNRKKEEVDEVIIILKDGYSVPKIRKDRNIRVETESKLLDELINFSDYKNDIKKRVLTNTLPESELKLIDVYAHSNFLANNRRSDETVEDYLKKWLKEPGQRQIALLGEYGQGKSSTAIMFTYHLLFESQQQHSRIPILIELRGKSPGNLTSLELLGAWASQYRIDPQSLEQLNQAGRLVLIFEGFDEMALAGNTEARIKHFKTLWEFSYPQSKILITGRPNFFFDNKEMTTALGISQPIGDYPYCEAIRLAPFSIDQIQQFLRNSPSTVKTQICTLAQNNPRFADLVSRPSLLHVVSVLWQIEKLSQEVEKLNSAYIMERFVKNSYRRQGLKLRTSKDFMALNSSERAYFMNGIATYMVANNLNNQISGTQLNKLISTLIDVIPESVSTSNPSTYGEDNRALTIRVQDPDDIEHVKTDVRTTGLLVDDAVTPGTFKFGHKSFMEYLFASTIADSFKQSDLMKINEAESLLKVTNTGLNKLIYLPESIGFLTEILGTNSYLTDNHMSKSDTKNQISIASKLLWKIFNVNTPMSKALIKLHLFEKVYICSLSETNYIIFPTIVRLTVPTNILIFFAFAMAIGTSLSIFSIQIIGAFSSTAFPLSITIVSALMSSFYRLISVEFNKELTRKFKIWNTICKDIKISDDVLHRIAGTNNIPWIKNQKFQYFYKKNNHS
jgi:CRISPR/Cas system CSM-associated protein Csm2 small subunit